MYQCFKEYSTVENSATKSRNQDYTFPWEYRAEASLTFGKDGKKSEAHCYFTSVYIDDSELMNKGLEEDSLARSFTAAIDQLAAQTNNLQMTDENAYIYSKNEKEEVETYMAAEYYSNGEKNQELNGGVNNEERKENNNVEKDEESCVAEETEFSWEQFKTNNNQDQNEEEIQQVAKVEDGEKLEKEREQWKNRKKAQYFSDKIRQLQFEPGFSFDPKTDADTDNHADLGQLENAEYETYPSIYRNNEYYKKQRKRKMASRSNSRTSPQITSNSLIKSSSTEEEEAGEEDIFLAEELSIEEKLQFKFSYIPERDRRLVAKFAKKFLFKDMEMMKYWAQRFRYFSRLNEGILMDKQCWYSVTPERLALHIAERLVPIKGCTILDPFTGSGCNSIQFALRGAFVFAFDLDPVKLLCANHNAKIYGTSNQINFICGDFFNIARSMMGALEAKRQSKDSEIDQNVDPYPFGIDAIYLSPPWGGPSYSSTNVNEFDIQKDMELDGFKIFETAKMITKNIVYFLPKNTSVNQLIQLAGPGGRVELEQSRLNDGEKVKALHAYYGRLISNK